MGTSIVNISDLLDISPEFGYSSDEAFYYLDSSEILDRTAFLFLPDVDGRELIFPLFDLLNKYRVFLKCGSLKLKNDIRYV